MMLVTGNNSTGWGLVLALAQVLYSVWVLGEVLLLLLLLSSKILHFKHWNTHVAYAAIPGSYSIVLGFDHSPSWPDFDCYQLHHYFGYCFAFGALGHCYWHFDCYFSDPSWIPVIGFSLVHFESP